MLPSGFAPSATTFLGRQSQRGCVLHRTPVYWWPLCTSCWAARLASPVFHLDGQTAGWCYWCAGAALQAQVTAAGTSRVLMAPVGDRVIVACPRLRLRRFLFVNIPFTRRAVEGSSNTGFE